MADGLQGKTRYANIGELAAAIVSALSTLMKNTADKVEVIKKLQNSGVIRDWINNDNAEKDKQTLKKVCYFKIFKKHFSFYKACFDFY